MILIIEVILCIFKFLSIYYITNFCFYLQKKAFLVDDTIIFIIDRNLDFVKYKLKCD